MSGSAGLGPSLSLMPRSIWHLTALLILANPGCGPSPAIPREFLKPPPPPTPYSAGDALKQFDTDPDPQYRLGEGDAITLQVWDRPDLSGPQVVGPDGSITVPVAGTLHVSGMTREEATKAVKDALSKFYAKISVTIRVETARFTCLTGSPCDLAAARAAAWAA